MRGHSEVTLPILKKKHIMYPNLYAHQKQFFFSTLKKNNLFLGLRAKYPLTNVRQMQVINIPEKTNQEFFKTTSSMQKI